MGLKPSPFFHWACLLLLISSCAEDSVIFKEYRTVFQIGDESNWASQNWNDAHWERSLDLVPDGQVFWSRTKIDIFQAPEAFRPYGLQIEAYGEYEVFWDGVLIGKNGNPGQETIMPPEGELWVTFSIPPHLTAKGRHVLALRLSNYHFPDHVGRYEMEIDHYDDLLTDRLIETSYIHIFAGAFLMASVYFLFLFLGNKKDYPLLIFGVCCFLFFGLAMTQFLRTAVPIHYSQHVLRLEVISSLMLGISFLIPLYFSIEFPFPKRKWLFGIYAVVLLYFFIFNHHFFGFTVYNMALSLWIFSLAIVGYGIYKKAKGAILVLLMLLCCVVLRYSIPFLISVYSGFALILLSMMYLLSIRLKEQRLAYETSLMQSTRLQLELVKKNIQPHFLMNTLTSLIDWVEEAPGKGVQFIEALAKEFDLLNQMEGETLVPIAQEIALCKTHLEIMSFRKEIHYQWNEEGIDPHQNIPPATLHTLLENGISHSLPLDNNHIEFKLSYESNSEASCYTFLTFAKTVSSNKEPPKEGTGLKYIKARLTESYQSNWSLTSEPADHGWRSMIKIYH